MKSIKHPLKTLALATMIGLSTASCQDKKYSDLEDGLYAEINTNKGTMVANLFYDKAPVTVANFVSLAEGTNTKVDSAFKGKKYYDGLIFHRVIDQFMIQGGDPTGTGTGGPGYKFKDEFHPDLTHSKSGMLSMANSGPTTNGSQFFITEKATPFLNNKHSIFGELVVGLDVQDSISNVKTANGDKPVDDVVIETVNIIRKGEGAKKFDAPATFLSYFSGLAEAKKKQEAQLETAKAQFIKENEKLGKIEKLPSGVVMAFSKEGKGAQPKTGQKVAVDYAGFLLDGKLFDTSIVSVAKSNNNYDERRDKAGQYKPLEIEYSTRARLIPGFREALLKMKVGDKAKVFIPSFLAYGERGAGGVIPPNANLIFELELTKILK